MRKTNILLPKNFADMKKRLTSLLQHFFEQLFMLLQMSNMPFLEVPFTFKFPIMLKNNLFLSRTAISAYVLVMAIAAPYACKKDFAEQEGFIKPFVAKPFVPVNMGDAKAKVKAFVATLNSSGHQRDSYENMEINEAKWVLEASGNFLWNQYFIDRIIHDVVEFPMEVANVVDGSEVKMSGSSMTAAFDLLIDSINTKISTSSQQAGGIDIVIDTVTSISSKLKAKVVITDTGENNYCVNANNDPNVDPSSNIYYINGTTEFCVNNQLLPPITLTPGCFWPDLYIVSYVGPWSNPVSGLEPNVVLGEKGKPCTTSTPVECLHGDDTEFVLASPTAAQFCWNQGDIALKIFEDIETEVFPPLGPGPHLPPPPITYTKFQLDLQVIHSTWSPHPGITFNWWQMVVANALWVVGPPVCVE
jgi:hypothetical protein